MIVLEFKYKSQNIEKASNVINLRYKINIFLLFYTCRIRASSVSAFKNAQTKRYRYV